MKNIISLSLVVVSLVFSGCGALKVRDKNEEATAKIKKAALVGFEVLEPASATPTLSLGKGGSKAGLGEGGSIIAKESENVDQMYTALATELSKNLGWKFTDRAKLTANAGYKTAYDKTMKGWQNKMLTPAGKNQFLVKNVMDAEGTRILDFKGRDDLISALGVDAIVVAKVDVNLKGTTMMGVGDRHPQSKVSFKVFVKGQEGPVWFDGAVEGETSKESVGKIGMFDESVVDRLSLESAKTAFKKIGSVATAQ